MTNSDVEKVEKQAACLLNAFEEAAKAYAQAIDAGVDVSKAMLELQESRKALELFLDTMKPKKIQEVLIENPPVAPGFFAGRIQQVYRALGLEQKAR